MSAVGEVNIEDALKLWKRVRETADDELESGKRGAKVAGDNTTPYSLAQYLAIRDSFADQWQPQGGIESAMVQLFTQATLLTGRLSHSPQTMEAEKEMTVDFEKVGRAVDAGGRVGAGHR